MDELCDFISPKIFVAFNRFNLQVEGIIICVFIRNSFRKDIENLIEAIVANIQLLVKALNKKFENEVARLRKEMTKNLNQWTIH